MVGQSDVETAALRLPTIRIDPFDPPPELSTLRNEQPMCPLLYPDGHIGWLVTSHPLARTLLADARFSIRPQRPPVGDPASNAEFFDASADFPHNEGALIELDPPQHTRIRRHQTGYFTVRRVADQRASIRRIVSDRLAAIESIGPPVDLVKHFCLPYSSLVLCGLLGVPEADRADFERPNDVIQDPSATPGEKMAALNEFTDYSHSVIELKRAQPGDDLLSELVATGDLTDMELTGLALQLFSAGHETTANMLALSVFALLSNQSRWDALRRDPELIEGAVEELLRYVTIAQLGAFTRTALEDVEVNGTVIRQGQGVTVSLSAANRDPTAFPDPDTLDVRRNSRAHLSFGHGRHMCLGQHLARLELQIALAGLVQRLPEMRLAVETHDVPLVHHEKFLHGVGNSRSRGSSRPDQCEPRRMYRCRDVRAERPEVL